MSAYFRPIILNGFPRSTWPGIRRCAIKGMSLADALIKHERWLDWPIGRDQRGDLRRVGVMWTIREACLSGELPFDCHNR
jgi:hypothetical protein